MSTPRKIILYLSLCVLCICQYAKAQDNSARFYAGGFYYLGDLAPLSHAFSLSQYNPGLGVAYTTRLTDMFDLEARFSWGRISGRDSDAKNEWRRKRNLSFDSSLYEFTIGTNIRLNNWLKFLDTYGLNLYYTTGVGVFHFSPKATYQGKLIALQPLATEGQGTALNPGKDKYKLTQISIPFGFGIKFRLSDAIDMGFEITPRWTFTDYLDDVSGEYIPYNDLRQVNGELSATLANRTGELLGTGPVITAPGKLRGDPEQNDWYFFMGVYLSYTWGTNKELESDEKELINRENLNF